MYVIPNPLAEHWLQKLILPWSGRTRDLVFLGRWSPEKGKDELLSFMRTLDLGRPIRCDIYTDHRGEDRARNCVFHSWLSESEVQQVLGESKVLLLPSHAEAFPTVLLEAAACGTPFVSTTIAGIPDIASESRAGLLHDVGDIEGMRKAVTALLTVDSLWADCSRNGRHWAESLEVSKIVPTWNRLYADLGVRVQESPASLSAPWQTGHEPHLAITRTVVLSRNAIRQPSIRPLILDGHDVIATP